MSQIFDTCLSVVFIKCRTCKLEKNTKNHKSYPFFCHKIKTKAQTRNLRHPR